MYDSTRLKQGFAGLVGFMQPYDPQYPLIPSNLTATSTGRSVQKTHPLCTLENLNNVAPEFAKFDYTPWEVKAYSATSIVSNDNKVWRASVDLNELYGEPGSGGSGNWVEVNMFGEWLQDIYNSSVIEMVSDLVRYKKLEHSNRTLIDSLKLYDGMGALADRIIKQGRFVGFEIKLSNQEGLAVIIDKIGIQLDTIQEIVPIYLYHSSVEEPLLELEIAAAKANSFSWSVVADAILKYYDAHDTDGVFYLGYYEDELDGDTQAIKRTSSWGTEPCYGCTGWNHYSWSNWSKHFSIQAFHATPTNGVDVFDKESIVYENDNNWGLNLAITVGCDLSEFFIQNKLMLGDALAQKICLKLLGEIAYTTRMNFINDKTRALALADLAESDKDSFLNKYLNELKALSVDFSGINSDCMPCIKKQGIKMGAV